jgi:hypothetical protein
MFMTSAIPHTLGTILQSLPVALVFSSQLLLTEKSTATVEAGLSESKAEPLFSIHATKLTAVLKRMPDPGWNHFGIND